MTTAEEAALLAAVAAEPGDETARLVYADWLEEHERPEEAAQQRKMAPGHRALAARRFRPTIYTADGDELTEWEPEARFYVWNGFPLLRSGLPADWWGLVVGGEKQGSSISFGTRAELTDAVALAFAHLPADRRQELLGAETRT